MIGHKTEAKSLQEHSFKNINNYYLNKFMNDKKSALDASVGSVRMKCVKNVSIWSGFKMEIKVGKDINILYLISIQIIFFNY